MVKQCETVWNSCLEIIREQVGEQSFNTWFKPIVPISLRDNTLTIQVPSQFFFEWLEDRYVHLLRRVLHKELGSNGRLEYSIIVDQGNDQVSPYTIDIPSSQPSSPDPEPPKPPKEQFQDRFRNSPYLIDSYINPQNTFSAFVEGDCNRLARSAGMAVAAKPGVTSFNPLMIYGGVGLGKTHLVQAIGNEINSRLPEKSMLYVSSEKFTNQFIEAVRNNNIQEFTQFYLQVDVLILDDVQFLAKKERTQEIFFHVFNHLQQTGKQIIMTSDRAPKDLQGMQDRLLSRFKWGLSADLQQPDFETRIAIIQKKLQADGIDVPADVIEYLATKVDTNVRELEGVLISLVAQASLNRKSFNVELAEDILQNIVQHVDRTLDIDQIKKKVSEHFGVRVDSLAAKSRKKEIVVARQVAMFFAKEYTDYSLKMIGQQFGGRDHSTVIHGLQAVRNMVDTDKHFAKGVEQLRDQFNRRG